METLRKAFRTLEQNTAIKAEIESAKDEFAFKPFALAYLPLAKIAKISRLFLAAFSVITGFGCLYFGMAAALPEVLAAVLAALVLLLVEALKGQSLYIAFRESYANSTLSPLLLMGLLFTAASIFASLQGVEALYRAADDSGQVLQSNHKAELDSAARAHDAAISAARNELIEFKKSVMYKGKIDVSNKQTAAVMRRLNDRIHAAENDKRDALKALTGLHGDQAAQLAQENGFNTTLWVVLSGANEALILFFVWFSVYYRYRIANDCAVIDEAAKIHLSPADVRRLIDNVQLHTVGQVFAPALQAQHQQPSQQPHQQPPPSTVPFERPEHRPIGFNYKRDTAPDDTHAMRNASSTEATPTDDGTPETAPETPDTEHPHALRNALRNASSTEGSKPKRTGDCAQCGREFAKRTTWHIYCSEACKIAAWEARTGKIFTPKNNKK